MKIINEKTGCVQLFDVPSGLTYQLICIKPKQAIYINGMDHGTENFHTFWMKMADEMNRDIDPLTRVQFSKMTNNGEKIIERVFYACVGRHKRTRSELMRFRRGVIIEYPEYLLMKIVNTQGIINGSQIIEPQKIDSKYTKFELECEDGNVVV